MENSNINRHFKTLYEQRKDFLDAVSRLDEQTIRTSPQAGKWSIIETHYHLYLMVKRLRQLNRFYFPLLKPIARLRKKQPYSAVSGDIYSEEARRNKKSLKAPAVLMPPEGEKIKLSLAELTQMTDLETKRLEEMTVCLDERVAGHIRYPDPVAGFPNVIQSVHLLAIHEKHHFTLCGRYYHFRALGNLESLE
ncbi:DinB family protein [Alteribacter natronophilus]|uniref:DinB family protein n=1 Tax=Alteribacter natronophilus TaxID=2583810 RepID=UPI00110D9E6D|nr:DinB family protein [Alteribacter natronophilus]TMW70375.1 DinB family protein [Alteribacter natronophilus]